MKSSLYKVEIIQPNRAEAMPATAITIPPHLIKG